MRPLLVDAGQTDKAEQLPSPALPALLRPASELEREGDVVERGAPGQEPRTLEDEPDPRIRAVDAPFGDLDGSGGRLQETGKQAEERALATPVRADQRDDLAGLHRQGQTREDQLG